MAYLVCNTAAPAPEPLPSTSATTLFGAFLSTLPRLVADETDLVGLHAGDPAFDAWFVAAEVSRAATLSALGALIKAPAHDLDEQALQRIGCLFQHAVLSDDPDEIAQIRGALAARRWQFRVPAALTDAVFCNALIDAALDLLDRYLALDDIGDVFDADLQDAEEDPRVAEADLDIGTATAA